MFGNVFDGLPSLLGYPTNFHLHTLAHPNSNHTSPCCPDFFFFNSMASGTTDKVFHVRGIAAFFYSLCSSTITLQMITVGAYLTKQIFVRYKVRYFGTDQSFFFFTAVVLFLGTAVIAQ